VVIFFTNSRWRRSGGFDENGGHMFDIYLYHVADSSPISWLHLFHTVSLLATISCYMLSSALAAVW